MDYIEELCAGREELAVLLREDPGRNGRSNHELVRDWLNKVTDAGCPKSIALSFITKRLALGDPQV